MITAADYDALNRAATGLEDAATTLDESGTSAPDGIDAGDLSGLLLTMVATALHSAAGLTDALAVAGAKLRESTRNYQAADDAAAASFTPLGP